ncbi:MAG: RNA-binding S4 domain-containing protein [Provencibacterium sp.]|jgi:ribosome-associated protein|nr:RNA-binding S4 domain-containing protein [Provencibacterium sp.]
MAATKKDRVQPVAIHTEFIRLDALLKLSGFAETGGQAKEMVLEGAVSVNGETELRRGRKLYPGDWAGIDDYRIEVVQGAVS